MATNATGRDERLPLVLEDGQDGDGRELHFSSSSSSSRTIWQRLRPIVTTTVMFAAIAAVLFTANVSRPNAKELRVHGHPEIVGLNLSPTATGSVAQSLLAQTSSVSQGLVLGHVHGRRAWGAHLSGTQTFGGTVFYPFGGVDALSVLPMFPSANSIVIAALHKVGDCKALSWSEVSDRTTMVASMMQGIFSQQGYFGTEEMYEHFDDTDFGVTPFLLAALSLMGEEPIKIECDAGVVVGASGTAIGLPAGNALRIVHRNATTGAVRELIYAQVDLLTPSHDLDRFLAAMSAQAPIVTFMKATGYILRRHEDNPVNRRAGAVLDSRPILKVIVSDSQAILQDDSGVRLSCLDGWSFSFWGTYVGPAFLANMTVSWRYDYDDSLHTLWCRTKPKVLPVRFGYPLFMKVRDCPAAKYNLTCRGESLSPDPVPWIQNLTPSTGFATYAVKR